MFLSNRKISLLKQQTNCKLCLEHLEFALKDHALSEVSMYHLQGRPV